MKLKKCKNLELTINNSKVYINFFYLTLIKIKFMKNLDINIVKRIIKDSITYISEKIQK